MFPTPRTLARISISAVTVAEFVVEEPSCYPVWAIASGSREVPIPSGMRVAALGDASHGFILRLLQNVAPVVGWVSLAVLLEVGFLRS